LEKILLIVLTILGFYFCLDFGYILTGYLHGGQLLGIPVAVMLAVFSGLTIFTKTQKKKIFRILTYGYFLTMLTYAMTVLIIREWGQENTWTYLYSMDGKADDFFIWISATGLLISVTIVILTYKKGYKQG